jgi:Uncharacterized protein conserved in bacteria (DUF2252)
MPRSVARLWPAGTPARAIKSQIAAYLGSGGSFDQAMTDFAAAYADQNQRDYRALRDAVDEGTVIA